MTAIENSSEIYFDKDTNVVIMEWRGYANSTQFREGTELMLNTLILHNTSKVLANIREMALIGAEDQEWLGDSFLPRAIRFGFKALAIVKPLSYFNMIAIQNIYYKIDREKLVIEFFDTEEEAIKWLKTV